METRSESARVHAPDGGADHRVARLLGIVVGLVTVVAYAPGLTRAFDFDGAETVGFFVVTPSWLDPLFRQREFNNPPLFSFIEHVIYELTGRHDAATMRVLPILCAGIAVGVLAYAVARRWGWPSGLLAAAVLASNPMFADESRAVRGYSLLVLSALGSTLVLLAMREVGSPTKRQRMAYTALAAAGLATHLFMLPVLLVHLAVVIDDHRHRYDGSVPLAERLKPVIRGIAIGAVPWIVILPTMLSHGQQEGRIVHPWYATDVAYAVIGGTILAAVFLTLAAATGVSLLRAHREVRVAAIVVGGFGLAMWLVVAPGGIVTRWFIWMVPVIAVLAARAAKGRPWVAAMVVVAIGSCLWSWVPTMTHPNNPTPQAARVIAIVNKEGLRACVENVSTSAVLAITQDFDPAIHTSDFAQCDVMVSPYPELDRTLTPAANRYFAYHAAFHEAGDGVIWSRRPIPASWLGGSKR